MRGLAPLGLGAKVSLPDPLLTGHSPDGETALSVAGSFIH
jgi:hypothetical protein